MKKNIQGLGSKAVKRFFEEEPQEQVQPEVVARKSPAGRPQKIKREIERSSQEGLPVNWTRYTVIVREDLLELLKDYAWTDRRSMKNIVNEMIEAYLADKEIIERGKDE